MPSPNAPAFAQACISTLAMTTERAPPEATPNQRFAATARCFRFPARRRGTVANPGHLPRPAEGPMARWPGGISTVVFWW